MNFSQRLHNWLERPTDEKLRSFKYNYRAFELWLLTRFQKPGHLIAKLPWGQMVVNTDWLGKNIYFGSYERKELMALSRIIKPGSIAIDIGANIGYYSIYMSKVLHCSKVLAFEPSPRELEKLKNNIALNHCTNVEVFDFALGDHETMIDLFLSDKNFGRNSINEFHASSKKITVPMMPLDAFLEKTYTGPVDLIKIDVEGAEPVVLQGAAATLRKHRPVIIYESWLFETAPFGEFYCEATSLIAGHQYSFFDIDERGFLIQLKDGMMIRSGNLIALPVERIREFSGAIK